MTDRIFKSTALGSPHEYAADFSDQVNMELLKDGGEFRCRPVGSSQPFELIFHTSDQAATVRKDFEAAEESW